MRNTRTFIAITAAVAGGVPAAIALADSAPSRPLTSASEALRASPAAEPTLRAQMRGHQHAGLLARYRRAADQVGAPSEGANTWSNQRLRQAISAARAQFAERKSNAARRPTTSSDSDTHSGTPSSALTAIAQCESGGNPRAVGGGGAYRGKYQFSYSTWAAVGGSGDPASASEAEQDRRAAMLYSRAGAGQWPVCGR